MQKDDKPAYQATTEQLCAAYSTDALQGLTPDEAARRLAQYGENRLPERKGVPAWRRFLSQFHNLLIYVLIVAALLAVLLGEWLDGMVIFAVVLVNATIGFVQEGKAEKALRAIQGMLSQRTHVIRDGTKQQVDSSTLVSGDLVVLEPGDRVPADVRIIRSSNLSVQEAALTGESVPVEKQSKPIEQEVVLADRVNMAFSGTLVTQGTARGLVVATGADTELGRINRLLSDVTELTTPLIRQMAQFARYLTLAILALAALVFVLGYVRGYDSMYLFMAVVSLIVAAIPEGLPTILTVALAIGVTRMARRNSVIRRLPAVETLGAVSVICSDKTGTLTRNEMTVETLCLAAHEYQVTGAGYAPEGKIIALNASQEEEGDSALKNGSLLSLIQVALLCNDAKLEQEGEHWHIVGDPMEAALLSLARKYQAQQPEDNLPGWQRVDEIPFDSRHKFMATLHDRGEQHQLDGKPQSRYVALIKGAPEAVLSLSRSEGQDWHQRVDEIASKGQRLLGFAQCEFDELPLRFDINSLSQVRFIGLAGFMDPPREEAKQAISACKEAGVRVVMITGDHAVTARAIGEMLGLDASGGVFTGAELDHMDEGTLAEKLKTATIFARTTPEQKLRLVTALQATGAVVAMTGDGVNDAPALKRADIGIAMGMKGTEAAREASEMVLTDDNFATIVNAVHEGRTVYDNLKKAIAFLLPVNGGESLAIMLALLFALTLPILPLQILWVNMVSSIALALALAFEMSERDVMKRAPRLPREPLITRFLLWRIGFVSILFTLGIFSVFEWALAAGYSEDYARTLAVNTLVAMEVWYLFSVRYLRRPSLFTEGVKGTPPVLIAVSLVFILQLLFTYAPPLQTLFQTESLLFKHGLLCVVIGMLVFGVLEIEKIVLRKWRVFAVAN